MCQGHLDLSYFENNFGMNCEFAMYLMESCRLSSDEEFSFRYFLNISFVREISPNYQAVLADVAL